jgi:hypothetical protein
MPSPKNSIHATHAGKFDAHARARVGKLAPSDRFDNHIIR